MRQINQQGKSAELATLSALENLIRSTGPLPGRKVVFFISDGFIADIKRSNGAEAIQRIGKQAADAGAVIYPLDTRAVFLVRAQTFRATSILITAAGQPGEALLKAKRRKNRWKLWQTRRAAART